MSGYLDRDLDDILDHVRDDLETLRGARVYVTGGTGFVGSWLLESFVYANTRLGLGARAVVLSRDPEAFGKRAPHIAHDEAITFLRGDSRNSTPDGTFDVVLHVATPASAAVNEETPAVMVDTIVDGTRRALEVAARGGAIPLLLTSSGAVYGRQPPELPRIEESYAGGPDPLEPRNAYHEAKRLSELQCAIALKSGTRAKIARLFAFVGPYLPLDRHFAIGNFIRDAMAGRTIEILGDGTPVRTYMYGADMTAWLWRILVRGQPARAYHVGSEDVVDIRATAEMVSRAVTPRTTVVVRGVRDPRPLPERYAPSTTRAREELGLAQWTPLEDSIRRTIAWQRGEPQLRP